MVAQANQEAVLCILMPLRSLPCLQDTRLGTCWFRVLSAQILASAEILRSDLHISDTHPPIPKLSKPWPVNARR